MKKYFSSDNIFGLILFVAGSLIAIFTSEIKDWLMGLNFVQITVIILIALGWSLMVATYVKQTLASRIKKEMDKKYEEKFKSLQREIDNVKQTNYNHAQHLLFLQKHHLISAYYKTLKDIDPEQMRHLDFNELIGIQYPSKSVIEKYKKELLNEYNSDNREIPGGN